MTDDANFWDCLERLDADENGKIAALIEASFHTDRGAITNALRTVSESHIRTRPTTQPPAPVFLSSIRVKGFRGIGPQACLELPVGPGLIVVTGRNGCGKSSFAEALELVLTGRNSRWTDSPRAQEMRAGWRNLHDGGQARIEVELAGERGVSRASVHWRDRARDPDEGIFTAEAGGRPVRSRAALGWSSALAHHGPILTYAGLGDLTKRSDHELYDQLRSMLGLGSLREAQDRLAAARRALENARRSSDRARRTFMPRLEALDDDRARAVQAALRQRPIDLEAIAGQCDGSACEGDEATLLRRLDSLTAPSIDVLRGAAMELRRDLITLQGLRATQAGRSDELAAVLRHALAWHQGEEEACPLCGDGTLDAAWRTEATLHLANAEIDATAAANAASQLHVALAYARSLLVPPPDSVRSAAARGIDRHVLRIWTAFSEGTAIQDPLSLANHLEQHAEPLAEAVADLRAHARERTNDRDHAWRPVAMQILAWLENAHRTAEAPGQIKSLRMAEKRLASIARELMIERFQPIEYQAKAIWQHLRQRSHVDLRGVELAGHHASPTRKVHLQVDVDGKDDVALGVMSQGELHSLALSLFLPRLTHEASPFRFVVLDDPVQAMDPYKVDGLARVLEEYAKTRQVIVFTHDERLPEAIARLKMEATLLSVHRGSGSTVHVELERDPVVAYLEEALAVSRCADQLGPRATARVVPGFCRNALEAFFSQTYRRRALEAGLRHTEVDHELASARTTTNLAALGMFGDMAAGAKVLPRIRQVAGPTGVAVYRACKEGAHEGWDRFHAGRIEDTKHLIQQLRHAT